MVSAMNTACKYHESVCLRKKADELLKEITALKEVYRKTRWNHNYETGQVIIDKTRVDIHLSEMNFTELGVDFRFNIYENPYPSNRQTHLLSSKCFLSFTEMDKGAEHLKTLAIQHRQEDAELARKALLQRETELREKRIQELKAELAQLEQ